MDEIFYFRDAIYAFASFRFANFNNKRNFSNWLMKDRVNWKSVNFFTGKEGKYMRYQQPFILKERYHISSLIKRGYRYYV